MSRVLKKKKMMLRHASCLWLLCDTYPGYRFAWITTPLSFSLVPHVSPQQEPTVISCSTVWKRTGRTEKLTSVISTVSWTGSVVQTAGVQRSTRCIIGGAGRGETDQAVGKHSESCLFYKQWEQIRIGAGLPQPYGEDVLCVGRHSTHHCALC